MPCRAAHAASSRACFGEVVVTLMRARPREERRHRIEHVVHRRVIEQAGDHHRAGDGGCFDGGRFGGAPGDQRGGLAGGAVPDGGGVAGGDQLAASACPIAPSPRTVAGVRSLLMRAIFSSRSQIDKYLPFCLILTFW